MHREHRKKLFSLFDEQENAIIYIKGAELMHRYDTDYEFPFRQESNFWYLSGVDEPDFHLIMDVKNREYHLFCPQRDAQFAVWHGHIKTKEQQQEEYEPDHLHYEGRLPEFLEELDPDIIYCLDEEHASFLEQFKDDTRMDLQELKQALTHCRVFKSNWELRQMRKSAEVNNIAHQAVLEALEPGKFEYEMKAEFEYFQTRHGLMQDAYNGIFGTGVNSAIMHYVDNTEEIQDGDLFLIDAGHEYNGYASDFTRTYPANGKFSDRQSAVYEAVLQAQKQVIEASVPGAEMEDLHVMAARVMMQGLKDAGIVSGSVDDLMEEDVFALFFPHGLGHFLGLDTHDVGGYPKGVEPSDRPGLKYLRTRRTLQPRMVITIEPGLYFIPALLKPALEDDRLSQFLNKSKVEDMMDFGGVRIEDNLIITEEGNENLTYVPKERDEIEQVMSKKSEVPAAGAV